MSGIVKFDFRAKPQCPRGHQPRALARTVCDGPTVFPIASPCDHRKLAAPASARRRDYHVAYQSSLRGRGPPRAVPPPRLSPGVGASAPHLVAEATVRAGERGGGQAPGNEKKRGLNAPFFLRPLAYSLRNHHPQMSARRTCANESTVFSLFCPFGGVASGGSAARVFLPRPAGRLHGVRAKIRPGVHARPICPACRPWVARTASSLSVLAAAYRRSMLAPARQRGGTGAIAPVFSVRNHLHHLRNHAVLMLCFVTAPKPPLLPKRTLDSRPVGNLNQPV